MASVPEFWVVWPQTMNAWTPGTEKRSHDQPHCICPPSASGHQIPMALGPVAAASFHPTYPSICGHSWIFSPPGKLLFHRRYSTNTLKIWNLFTLGGYTYKLFHWLDLRFESNQEGLIICGLFLQDGLLKWFAHSLELCNFLVCNHVSPNWMAERQFILIYVQAAWQHKNATICSMAILCRLQSPTYIIPFDSSDNLPMGQVTLLSLVESWDTCCWGTVACLRFHSCDETAVSHKV